MIRQSILIILYFWIAIIIQSLFSSTGYFTPDLILLGILAISCLRGGEEGLIAGLIGGVLHDLTSSMSGGFFTLVKGGLALLVSLIKLRMVPDAIIIPVLSGFIGTLLHEWFFYGIINLAHWKLLYYNFNGQILVAAIFNAAIAPLIFLFFQNVVYHKKQISVK